MASHTAPSYQFTRLGQPAAGPRQIVLVPGSEVPLLPLSLPKGLRGRAREQVARRQAADRIGQHGHLLNILPFSDPAHRDRWTRVLVTHRDQQDQWRDLPGQAVLPDYLALPTSPGLWTLSPTPEGLSVRLGPEDGFSARPELLDPMLTAALAENPRPKALLTVGEVTDALKDQLTTWATAQDLPLLTSVTALDDLNIPPPQVLAHGELRCDLRNDPIAAHSRLSRQLRPWRWTFLLAGLTLGLWAATQIIATNRMADTANSLTRSNETLARQHFLGNAPLLDLRIQVADSLAKRRAAGRPASSETDPISLLFTTSEILSQSAATPKDLTYQHGIGLTLSAELPDFAQVDTLAQNLRDTGLSVQLGESSVQDLSQTVRAEYLITPADPAGPRP